jgi:hypothetical protein
MAGHIYTSKRVLRPFPRRNPALSPLLIAIDPINRSRIDAMTVWMSSLSSSMASKDSAQPPTILMICPTPMQRALLSLTRLRMIAATSARFPTSRFAKPISAFS